MANIDYNVSFKTSTTATIDNLFNWNKSTGNLTPNFDENEGIPFSLGTLYFTSDGHLVFDTQIKNKTTNQLENTRLWIGKNAYSAIYAQDISDTTDISSKLSDISNTLSMIQIHDNLIAITSERGDLGSGASPRYLPYKWYITLDHPPFDGEVLLIKTPSAGNTAGIYLSIEGDNDNKYHPVAVGGNTRLTTQYALGNIILLIYQANQKATVYPLAGANSTVAYNNNDSPEGIWRILNYYDSGNTNTLLRTYALATNKEYPLVGLSTNTSGSTPASHTSSYKDLYGMIPSNNKATINLSTGKISASGGFQGNLTGNATTASNVNWSGVQNKPTTIAGYGITDAKINNGTITLGNNSITPLISFTETDPTVPSWAKASTKPSYTWNEINNKPTTFNPPVASTTTLGGIKVGNGLNIDNEFLNIDGIDPSNGSTSKALSQKGTWIDVTNNLGTVTSISASGNNGITISGSPITTSGTITVGLNLNTAINGLEEGTSPATRNDYIIAQYSGGGTTTTSYYRRKLSNIFKALNSSDITTALGYTPYNSTNPNGYTTNTGTVTSITLNAGDGISLDTNNTAITTSGSRTIALQTAGESQLGGIKIGNGLDIDANGIVSIDISELGLSTAMHFIGASSTGISQSGNQNPTINGVEYNNKQPGDVVLYNTQEFVYTANNTWQLLGDESSYKIKQNVVSDPSANGKSTSFIKTISQDANGIITATKANLPTYSLEANSNTGIKYLEGVSSTKTSVVTSIDGGSGSFTPNTKYLTINYTDGQALTSSTTKYLVFDTGSATTTTNKTVVTGFSTAAAMNFNTETSSDNKYVYEYSISGGITTGTTKYIHKGTTSVVTGITQGEGSMSGTRNTSGSGDNARRTLTISHTHTSSSSSGTTDVITSITYDDTATDGQAVITSISSTGASGTPTYRYMKFTAPTLETETVKVVDNAGSVPSLTTSNNSNSNYIPYITSTSSGNVGGSVSLSSNNSSSTGAITYLESAIHTHTAASTQTSEVVATINSTEKYMKIKEDLTDNG